MSDLKPKILFSTLILAIIFSCNNKREEVSVVNHWSKMQQIIDSISVPAFSDKVFSVMDYGSVADGVFDNTKSFEDAIKACSKNGGGKVLIPKGKYFSGPIHLEDNRVGRFGQVNADPVAALHAPMSKPIAQPVAQRVEIRVRDLRARVSLLHGDVSAATLRRVPQPIMNAHHPPFCLLSTSDAMSWIVFK
jgi:hypothetical protein